MTEPLTWREHRSKSRRTARRGFTMVELLVSMTGALFLSASVFMVAKHTTGLYQEGDSGCERQSHEHRRLRTFARRPRTRGFHVVAQHFDR